MASEHGDDHAGVVTHPPFIYLAGILVGLGLDYARPAPMLPAVWQYAAGGALIALGVGLVLASALRFHKAGTTVPTHTPTTAIVADGLYRFSRNPIYVGLTTIYLGVAIMVDSAWILGMLVPVLVVMNIGVIAREERYLERKFGDQYLAYKARVRRWL